MTETTKPEEEKFSVYQFFTDDSYEHVLRWVPAEEAVKKAHSLARSVGGQIGTTKRVVITDSGDHTVWEWIYGKGRTFPVTCNNAECKAKGVLADEPCKSCGTVTGPIAL